MHIYFAGDHAGFEMKRKLIEFVRGLGHEVEDLGPLLPKAGDDYPDFVIPLAKKVTSYSPLIKGTLPSSAGGMSKSSDLADSATSFKKGGIEDVVRGIVVAGSGQGEIIAMNRVKGARAALFCPCPETQISTDDGDADKRGCRGLELIKASRDHNDSNIFAIGARFCNEEQAMEAVKLWLETPFSNDERHIRRLRKIEDLTG